MSPRTLRTVGELPHSGSKRAFRARKRSPVQFAIAFAERRAWFHRMSRLGRPFLYDRDIFVTVAYFAVMLAILRRAIAWGRKGHQI
jgi:hypothetical protein